MKASSIICGIGCVGLLLRGNPADQWQLRYQLPPAANALNGIAYGNGVWVAVGISYGGTASASMLTSTNGLDWTSRSPGPSFTGVAFGNRRFVALRLGSPTGMLTSSNGVDWSVLDSGPTNYLWGITFGDGGFVAVGEQGAILTSPDGLVWTNRNSGTAQSLHGTAWGGGQYLALGNSGTLLTSPDGATWTTRTPGTIFPLYGAAYGGNQYVVVGGGFGPHAGVILTSPDGIQWTSRYEGGQVDPVAGVAYGNGTFVAVGGDSSWFGILTSPDGISWVKQPAGGSTHWKAVSYANDLFVAVGGDANWGTVLVSADGTNWTTAVDGRAFSPKGLAYGRNAVVAVGSLMPLGNSGAGSAAGVVSSVDGAGWKLQVVPGAYGLADVVFAQDMFVAVGDDGTVLTSADGLSWTKQAPINAGGNDLRGICYAAGRFVAVGGPWQNLILTSTNGSSWSPSSYPKAGSGLYSVAGSTNGWFVAIGDGGGKLWTTVMRSTNGTQWSVANTLSFWETRIAYGNGRFVATGNWVVESAELSSWRIAAQTNLANITYGGGQFVGVGCGGSVLSSVSGEVFIPRQSGSTDCLRAVVFGRNSFFGIGDNAILESGFSGPARVADLALDTGANRTMVVAGELGRSYTLQRSPGLTPPAWQDLLTFTNTLSPTVVTDASTPVPARAFYRLQQLDYAPASIAGRSVTVTIVGGDGVFAQAGSYRFSAAATGNAYTLTALSGPIASTLGTYTYTKIGGEIAVLVLTDVSSAVSSSTIYYTDANLGEVVTAGVSGLSGHQFGIFTAN